ncbi:hypothetical protein [Sphingomonas baiyangensis]|uniref:Integron n=1 Tax=Sphingomonas baiyangensis TaxID=2572576 RepID=A0A4U1L1Z9_9SPHN|nr:hypothetical protein [Sphingomonas baiyangensis]TKD50612.1 hypothetical protein FBR43_07410 [Sphingomonas baiyangensis]
MRSILLATFLLAGCNFATVESNVQTPDAQETPEALAPSARGVRVGEGGPGFAACQSQARVDGPQAGAGAVPMLDAPFDGAAMVVALPQGAALRVCTRTIDQRWLGVVVPREGVDCGVDARLDRPRTYAGPCASGWIAANAVRLTG